jgi:excisionase family DNA binding protein
VLLSIYRNLNIKDKIEMLNIKRLTMTVEEAGEALGLGRNKAYEAVSKGEIPSIRFGKRIVVPRHALFQLLETAGKV